MKSVEKAALYSTIQTFVGKWWNGSDLYPDPCGWTPIEVTHCVCVCVCFLFLPIFQDS